MKWLSIFEKVLFNDPITEAPQCPQDTWTVDYAVWRLWQAKTQNPSALLDHAVLTRQCLRWLPNKIRGDRLSDLQKMNFAKVGLRISLSGHVEADPYRPDWIDENDPTKDLDSPPQIATINESLPAEEWLKKTTGKSTWRSSAQKEACWTVLNAAPGDTNLIGLPTGAGKSLVFQVAAAYSSGLTVVVVPTVALGLDQLTVAKSLPSSNTLNPMNYSSDDEADAVLDAVKNRHCRLLFTSPEACVSGRLRPILDKLARDGWMQWTVVDEAHIVESWGADFRVEFQLLGALVRNWRVFSDNRLRTLLLSATFAESTKEMLRILFTDQGQPWLSSVVQRLRPEIHYHIKLASNKEQQINWISQALLMLPRPLILYVTEKDDARDWYTRAMKLGFSRVECFHGDVTQRGQRARIMDAWRSNKIDLMVATSAFGMGVDKPDVRTVIHACFPESIDRFYQEVGRGGRDGASTQSIMIYTEEDKISAKGLAPTLLLPKTINERWSALWSTRKVVEGESEVFKVRCDSRGSRFIGLRTYQEHVRWNKRLLIMLHRAKLLTIIELKSEKNDGEQDQYTEWVSIRDLNFPSIDFNVGDRLLNIRNDELNNISIGFKALENCAEGRSVCRELQKYYGRGVARACGSCIACRTGMERRGVCRSLQWPVDSTKRKAKINLVPMPQLNNRNGKSAWLLALRRSFSEGLVNRLIVDKDDYEISASLMKEALQLTANTKPYRLDIIDGDNIPLIGYEDKTLVLHPSVFRTKLSIANDYGSNCTHWMPADQIDDPNGRARFTQDNHSRRFESMESWLFEAKNSSS